MMDTLILMLFISSLASVEVFGQDVDIRTGEKVSADGGQSRTIYSQRRLTPHRMMHFGKRPVNPAAPTIIVPQVYGDLQQPEQRQQQQLRLRPDRYPYLLSIQLERGQTLHAVPEDISSSAEIQAPNSNLLYTLEHQPQIATEQQVAARQQQQQGEQKFLKLLSSNDERSEDEANDGDKSSAANVQEDNIRPQQQEPQQSALSVSTRSIQSGRASTLNIPKAYISSLLYGRQGSSLPNFGSYNKKAEPKDNFFMHFGRK